MTERAKRRPTRNDANLRIDRKTDRTLDALARATGEAKKAIVAVAVERMRREQLFSEANEGYAELRRNSTAWAKEMEERELLDRAVADGLESE